MKRLAPLILLSPCILIIAACSTGCGRSNRTEQPPATAQAVAQQTYATPEDAVVALIDTCRKANFDLLLPIFGPQVAGLAADTMERTEGDMQRIAAAYDRKNSLVKEDDGSVTLLVGEQEWDFPAPLLQQGGRWRFDTDAGVAEMQARRIIQNEADAVRTCLDLVDAQRQFHGMSAARGESTPSYAPTIRSTPGKRDGLFWDEQMAPPRSPLGPMAEYAIAAGELRAQPGTQPYRGYMFRVLTRQSNGAPGGERNYIDGQGRMTGGFAFIAWPAEYGQTGVLSFQIAADGTLFSMDLGTATATKAKAMQAFDPSSWEAAK